MLSDNVLRLSKGIEYISELKSAGQLGSTEQGCIWRKKF